MRQCREEVENPCRDAGRNGAQTFSRVAIFFFFLFFPDNACRQFCRKLASSGYDIEVNMTFTVSFPTPSVIMTGAHLRTVTRERAKWQRRKMVREGLRDPPSFY